MQISCHHCGKELSGPLSNAAMFRGDINCSKCSDNPTYPERHFQGTISVEKDIKKGYFEGDIGIQISHDGRIWICIDGIAAIRFKPKNK